jgi:hypothetical protein
MLLWRPSPRGSPLRFNRDQSLLIRKQSYRITDISNCSVDYGWGIGRSVLARPSGAHHPAAFLRDRLHLSTAAIGFLV